MPVSLYRKASALVALFAVTLSGVAMAAPVVVAAPNSFTPEAELLVKATGLAANEPYMVVLESADGLWVELDQLVDADSQGRLSRSYTVPTVASGQWQLQVLERSSGAPVVMAFAPVTVRPGLDIQLTPGSAQAKSRVDFSVADVGPGIFRLDYEGVAVFGPEITSGGTVTGSFFVPTDRPASLPGNALVEARLMAGDQLSEYGQTTFAASPAPGGPMVQVTHLSVPPGPVKLTQPFAISGSIQTEGIDPASLNVSVWWFGDDGSATPMSFSYSQVLDNGDFSVMAIAPNVLTNHANIVGWFNITDGGPAVVSTDPQGPPGDDSLIEGRTVHTEDFDTSRAVQSVPNALVMLESVYSGGEFCPPVPVIGAVAP